MDTALKISSDRRADRGEERADRETMQARMMEEDEDIFKREYPMIASMNICYGIIVSFRVLCRCFFKNESYNKTEC